MTRERLNSRVFALEKREHVDRPKCPHTNLHPPPPPPPPLPLHKALALPKGCATWLTSAARRPGRRGRGRGGPGTARPAGGWAWARLPAASASWAGTPARRISDHWWRQGNLVRLEWPRQEKSRERWWRQEKPAKLNKHDRENPTKRADDREASWDLNDHDRESPAKRDDRENPRYLNDHDRENPWNLNDRERLRKCGLGVANADGKFVHSRPNFSRQQVVYLPLKAQLHAVYGCFNVWPLWICPLIANFWIQGCFRYCSTKSVWKKDFCLSKSENGFRILLWNPKSGLWNRIGGGWARCAPETAGQVTP